MGTLGTLILLAAVLLVVSGICWYSWKAKSCCGVLKWGDRTSKQKQPDLEMQRDKPTISGPIEQQPQWETPSYKQPQMQYMSHQHAQWQPPVHQHQAQEAYQPHYPQHPPQPPTKDLYPTQYTPPPQAHTRNMPAYPQQQQHQSYEHVPAPPRHPPPYQQPAQPPQQAYAEQTPYAHPQPHEAQPYQLAPPPREYQSERNAASLSKQISSRADSRVLDFPSSSSSAKSLSKTKASSKSMALDSLVPDFSPRQPETKKVKESQVELAGFEDVDLDDKDEDEGIGSSRKGRRRVEG